KKKPEDGYIIDSMGWVYYKKGDYGKALIEITRAHEKLPDDPTIAEHLADVYVKLNEVEKAREFYEKAISLEKDETKKKSIKEKLRKLESDKR
ncbi:MAG TPA: tetratricopeptide repeat protein, partial [Syntrophorhabdaceae bacterium]|nr:tetratricopeptide repeat protein [Syntrophorhabdaceae bacterium]